MSERQYDLVVLGATGFTGGLVAQEVADRLDGDDRRWAIAGRNEDKLTSVRDALVDATIKPEIEVVDSHDASAMRRLAEQTRVLVTTVGPFAQHGELAVQACALAGTDYIDSTGESSFVDMTLQRYDADARASGARIVHACGFDSIPADLGTRFTVARLPGDAPITVRAFVSGTGRPSGGTWNSLLNELGSAGLGGLSAKPRRDGHRSAAPLPFRPARVRQIGGVGLPAPLLDIDVVLRSARALPAYGPDFRYGHYALVGNPLVAAGLGLGAGALFAGAQIPPVRNALKKLQSPGEGPTQEARARSRFTLMFHGQAAGHEVITRLTGSDPGYGGTAEMMVQAAMSLLEDPLPETAGVVTTAEVFEGGFLERRLNDNGIVNFEVVSG